MRLMAVFVAIVLIFGTAAYMVAAVPAITALSGALGDAPGATEEVPEHHDRIETIALRIAPMMFIIAAIVFAFLAVTSRQRRVGLGGHRGGGRL